ncbi:hypothetical protein [Streptomyces fungicidicus]|uniref:hypothetical protein n=1 Tax=Streptomyces fungicidicus TaxID=68203 RepID=UPI00380C95D0
MTDFTFPDTLLAAEHAAWEAIQTGTLTVAQATAVHDGITEFAAETGTGRYEVEMALKKTVRHPEG